MELKLEDLYTTCPKCKGEGSFCETQTTGAMAGVISRRTAGDCKECGGKGGHLTKAGEALQEFMRILKLKGPF